MTTIVGVLLLLKTEKAKQSLEGEVLSISLILRRWHDWLKPSLRAFQDVYSSLWSWAPAIEADPSHLRSFFISLP
jgi:hypothetical protein